MHEPSIYLRVVLSGVACLGYKGGQRETMRPLRTFVKVLLHCAIFSATCLATVENVALQVAEVWC